MDAAPLVISSDQDLLDDVLRAAAAAGVDLDQASAPDSRSGWRTAPLVLIDANEVGAAVLAGLPRRPGVVMVSAAEPESAVWEQCVVLGVERTVVLPFGEDELVEILADSVDTGPGGGRVVALVGAGGGAGASVLAAAVAVAGLRRGTGVLLADCDRWGPGLDVLLGMEADPGLRWDDLTAPSGRVPVDALHQSLPSMGARGRRARAGLTDGFAPAGLSVLAHDRSPGADAPTPEALSVLLESCRRAGELAVVDLPRAPDPAADRAAEAADLVVLVSCADVPSCYSARRLADRLVDRGVRLGLVVRGPSPGGLGATDLAEALELPLIAQMRPQPQLARDLEWGRAPGINPRSPLGRAADKVVTAVQGGWP